VIPRFPLVWLSMIFTAYIDESDTHGSTPDITMSSMLASAERWKRCERGLRRIKADYGFDIIHTVDFRTRAGDFRNWPHSKFRSLLDDVGELLRNNLTETVTVWLRYSTYKENFLDARPLKMPRTSQYGLCFHAMLLQLARVVMDQGPQHKLSIVLEHGHKNARETAHIFEDVKKELQSAGVDLLRSHILASKQESPPLMFADIAASGESRRARVTGRRGAAKTEGEGVGPGELGWTHREVTPEYLRMLIDQFESGRLAARDEWLKRRQAWRTANGQ